MQGQNRKQHSAASHNLNELKCKNSKSAKNKNEN